MSARLEWLGQGVSAEAGNKALILDQLSRAGLPVPAAAVVLFSEGASLKGALSEVRTRLGDGSYAVRSSFPGEDDEKSSQAGLYRSLLRVTPPDLESALLDVHRSGQRGQVGFRGVLVQLMVPASQAGVIFFQHDFLDPLALVDQGTAERLLSGEVAGSSLELTPDVRGRQAAWRSLAERVREVLGATRFGWDIEFADDGKVAWVVQARPITRPPLRDELFSYANIREILPDPPSPFMASVIASAGLKLYEYYRRFDPTLPDSRPLIELVLGRPMFNISLLAETMRHWGLPTRLVTDQIGGADLAAVGLRPAQIAKKWTVLARQGWAQLGAVGAARKAIAELENRPLGGDLAALAGQTEQLFHHLVTVMLNLTAAMAVPLTLLRRLGTLEEHSRAHRTPTGRLLSDLRPLRALQRCRPDWSQALSQGEAPEDPDFQGLWRAYLSQHGHRGVFESDLASPRIVEAPGPVLRSLLGPDSTPRPLARTWRGWLTLPLWLYTRRVLDTRELWRDTAMRAYFRLRLAALSEAKKHGLPHEQSIFDATAEEWRQVAGGLPWTPDFWQRRAAEKRELRRYRIPDLVRRFQPRSAFLEATEKAPRSRVEGTPLCGGTVEGKIWHAQDATSPPPTDQRTKWILLTRTVDPAWLFHLPHFDGAIVELGGDLSHGSILLRELGIPAITNASGACQALETGETVRLVASEGYAEKVSSL